LNISSQISFVIFQILWNSAEILRQCRGVNDLELKRTPDFLDIDLSNYNRCLKWRYKNIFILVTFLSPKVCITCTKIQSLIIYFTCRSSAEILEISCNIDWSDNLYYNMLMLQIQIFKTNTSTILYAVMIISRMWN
jgi:hypothetical protein